MTFLPFYYILVPTIFCLGSCFSFKRLEGYHREDIIYKVDGRRIVHGTPLERKTWPWLVSFHFKPPIEFTNTTGMKHLCAGTLITRKPMWIVTAAHCFSDDVHPGCNNPDNWDVVIGEYNQYIKEKEVYARIAEIHLHENFTAEHNLTNDIALIKLKSIYGYNFDGPGDLDRGEFYAGTLCSVAGWGQISFQPSNLANFIPLITTVRLIPVCTCRNQYETLPYYVISSATVCAGTDDGNDACEGDSGGPLMCQSETDNRWKLVGITSSGHECGLPNFPGIYTRVSSFIPWIENITHAGEDLTHAQHEAFIHV